MDSKKNKVVVIAPEFYHYHTSIVESLVNNGSEAIFFAELPTSFFYRVVKNFSSKLYSRLLNNYFKRIAASIVDINVSHFLVIRAESMPLWFLHTLRDSHPNAKFVMYQWDSHKNNEYKHLLNFFDKVATFDPIDAVDFGIFYQPLFFIKRNKLPDVDRSIDYLFVGSLHGDRLEILKKFKSSIPTGQKVKFHIYISFFSYLKLLLKGRFIKVSDISFQKVSFQSLELMIKKSKNVIDLCSRTQTGITVRSFEALSSGCRLITNNDSIAELFPQLVPNIDIIDTDFFVYKEKYDKRVSSSADLTVMEDYELDRWLKRLLHE